MTQLKYKGKDLIDCEKQDLVDFAQTVWSMKETADAQREGYENLLKSDFPIHKLWKNLFEKIVALIWVLGTFYLLLEAIK